MDGVDISVTRHLSTTCTACVRPGAKPNGGVKGGHGSTTKPFVCLEENGTKFLPCFGANVVPKVMEILTSA